MILHSTQHYNYSLPLPLLALVAVIRTNPYNMPEHVTEVLYWMEGEKLACKLITLTHANGAANLAYTLIEQETASFRDALAAHSSPLILQSDAPHGRWLALSMRMSNFASRHADTKDYAYFEFARQALDTYKLPDIPIGFDANDMSKKSP